MCGNYGQDQVENDKSLEAGSDMEHGGHQDEDAAPWAVIIGASNCRQLKVQNPCPYQTETHVPLGGVERVLKSVEAPKDQIDTVLLHVGTCEFDANKGNNVKNIYNKYLETVLSVQHEYPGADVLIASVPYRAPRPGQLNERVNREITQLNGMLWDLAHNEPNVSFIDSAEGLQENGQVLGHLHKHKYQSGV